MKKNEAMKEGWAANLEHLRQLPFIQEADIRKVGPPVQTGFGQPDAILRIKTPRGKHEFYVEVKKTHLTYTLVGGLMAQARRTDPMQWILLALYVPRKIGRYMGELGINWVDQAGNCRLQIGVDYIAVIEGRRPIYTPATGRGVGAAGYRVLFTVLAKPELLDVPVRALADAAAVGKTTAAETIARLQQEGLVGPGMERRRIIDPKALLDRWILGYETTVRHRMIIGRFRTPDPQSIFEAKKPSCMCVILLLTFQKG
jgi:hypothetical protein